MGVADVEWGEMCRHYRQQRSGSKMADKMNIFEKIYIFLFYDLKNV